MQISSNSVVQFHYTITENGTELESSRQGDAMLYLHGHNQMLPKLEEALQDKNAGDTLEVTLAPVDAYGERKADAIQSVQVKHLQGAKKWKPGMVAWVNTDHGERQVTIVKMGMFKADVDTNHPLAGKTVTFHIEILSVREATEEELAHGHAHGAGGHQH
ncbi:peptidylprolyl isomerase [Alishewanella sp. 16-MA]|uniref:Peptidyl-prolyl cis-trans isomerase n=1 Tax=Alishewanella maricola TaxID=2795740 RepID=A0ABS8C1C0_9ALTE|nr:MULTISPECIES: peptidylprolyl isomerase [Gammaproteobacteria]MDP4945075.1 peptidylprolyl isomerase [Alishewanella sp.]MCB5226122.1 peptidylprolyl isomerase [Alishewanella maricola]MCC5450341.1 peptidylprolyl isomerase [Rheinheimera sp. UJ51]MCF4009228.1 peptidylprolyl isomerase [Rheinheimera sp. UJ63]MDP5036605.1 peptidylprolyl isomerase [Alishewanella sp.]